KRDAVKAGEDGAVSITGVDAGNRGPLRTFEQLVGLIEDELGDDDTRRDWVAGSPSTGSVNAFLRRLRSAVRPLSALIRGDLRHRLDHSLTTCKAQVTGGALANPAHRPPR